MSSPSSEPAGPFEHAAGPPVPTDVVLARAAAALLQGMLLSAGMVVLLALITGAAVLLAGPRGSDPVVVAGESVTGWAAMIALVATVVCWRGHLDHLRDSREVADAAAVLRRTRRRLAWLPRLVLAGCVVAITAWLLLAPGAFVGALVGSVVALQVALVLRLVRDGLLDPARLTGPPRPPLAERIRRLGG